jgi:hypothetical protein
VIRPQQVTRSLAVAHQVPVPRDLSQGFFWSASLTAGSPFDGSAGTVFPPGASGPVAHESPVHATNGVEDFDLTEWPIVYLVFPRDGIYGISFFADVFIFGPTLGSGEVTLDVRIENQDAKRLRYTFDGTTERMALQYNRVGIPVYAGTRMYVFGWSEATTDVWVLTRHLEATYLGPIGTVYNVKQPGP